MARLLLIDDDRDAGARLAVSLAGEGFEVDQAGSGEDVAARAASGAYALMVIDVALQRGDGLALLGRVRRASGVPVIVVSGRASEADRVTGLELGADDYLPKPCPPRELAARIRAILRRVGSAAQRRPRTIDVDDLCLEEGQRTVRLGDTTLALTSAEFDLLLMLMRSAGEVVGREAIAESVLGCRLDPFDRRVDMHVSRVRRKIGLRQDGQPRIKSIRGVGYLYTRAAARRDDRHQAD